MSAHRLTVEVGMIGLPLDSFIYIPHEGLRDVVAEAIAQIFLI